MKSEGARDPPARADPRPGRPWKEILAIARTVYTELCFQAIYALKLGNLPGEERSGNPAQKARRRVAQSKLMVSLLMFLLIASALFTMAHGESFIGLTLPVPLYDDIILSGTLLLGLSLLWMIGLQLVPTLSNSRVFPWLSTLPLSRRDLKRVSGILLVWLFDLPAAVLLVFLPVGVGLLQHSWVAGLWTLPATAMTLVFALALSFRTGRFFLERVSGSPSGGSSVLLRWTYLLFWTIPSLAVSLFVSFSVPLLRAIEVWSRTHAQLFELLLLTFPFAPAGAPFGPFLSGSGIPAPWTALLGLAGVIYGLLAVGSGLWLWRTTLDLGPDPPATRRGPRVASVRLKRTSPVRAILTKDLRIASRNPGYAFLILLPLLDALVIGLSTYVENPVQASVVKYALAAVTVAALLATFFGPAFFATEVLGYSLTRTLPLTRRQMLLGKSSLVLLIYGISCVLVMSLVATRLADPFPFAGFAASELPAVIAAALLQVGILLHQTSRTGLPVANLYSGAWWTTLVVVPGLLVAGLPLLLFTLEQSYDGALALPFMAASSTLLLVSIGTWAFWGRARAP